MFYLCYTVNIRFFSTDSWIIFTCSIVWVPQIIHNLTSNELKNIPLISLLIINMNRILFPLYLRVLDDSFFLLHKRVAAIFLGILILIIHQIIIYYQVKYGGAFFLPTFLKNYVVSIKDEDNVTFFSKNEFFNFALKNKSKFENFENSDCTICLQSILSNEDANELKKLLLKQNIIILDEQLIKSKEYMNLDEESNTNSYNDSKIDELETIEQIDVKNMSFLKVNDNIEEKKGNLTLFYNFAKENITWECITNQLKILFNIFFTFHKYKTVNKLRYKIIAITNECNHMFHCICLTDWLSTKMECPIDRKQIILDI